MLVKQKTWDDCSVASIAMVTGLGYEAVHEAAKEAGYVRGSGEGVSIGDVICNLDWDMEWAAGFIDHELALLSVASLKFADRQHAVVLKAGKIFDPSKGEHVTYEHCVETCSYTYFRFKAEPPHWKPTTTQEGE